MTSVSRVCGGDPGNPILDENGNQCFPRMRG